MLIVSNVLGCFLPDVVAEEALDITHAEDLRAGPADEWFSHRVDEEGC